MENFKYIPLWLLGAVSMAFVCLGFVCGVAWKAIVECFLVGAEYGRDWLDEQVP